MFSSHNDPLTAKEKKLRNQISAVEKQIIKLEKAKKKIEKGEIPPPSGKNPFDDPLTQLKNRPKLFQNPGDEDKFRLKNKDSTHDESFPEEEADLELLEDEDHSHQEQEQFKVSLNKLVKASQDDPELPTEDESRFLKYLAAGNVDGIQKLQFEKGVDRNRKLVMVIVVIIVISAIYLYFKNI